MAVTLGVDWSSDSEDSLFGDDGDYDNFKHKTKYVAPAPKELTPQEKQTQELTNIFNAIAKGSIKPIEDALANGFDINTNLRDNWTSILLAASYGNPEMIKFLIEAGADVNQDRGAETPLMMVCSCPDYTSPFEKSFEVIKMLVEKGADVRAINRKRMDALMYAACTGNLLAVEYLLPIADKRAIDNQRWSALTWAVSNNKPDIVNILWQNGFDINSPDIRGFTALDLAKENGLDEIVKIFPKKDTDRVVEILHNIHINFEQNFLSSDQKPLFLEDVCDFLISIKCQNLVPLFYDKKVALNEFLAMNDTDLKSLGVHLPYQRNRILAGLHRFHKQPYDPQSLHICINNDRFTNVDVAIELLSAIKQIVAMEGCLKYLMKHLDEAEVSLEDREMARGIKLKVQKLMAVNRKLEKKLERWDADLSPADLITKKSVGRKFPWKKISICFGVVSLVLFCKLNKY
ncbi:unnamed protein product [Ceutorhynchus assimilis]|uniref:SAM domain-containing protein n=1 Tax=Ceutorhynchus assimilis TaxID=467358 RepID=A0A9N9QIM3_9CUCU|nr:unnamed protein product [Ceutorhynchus assimilis]